MESQAIEVPTAATGAAPQEPKGAFAVDLERFCRIDLGTPTPTLQQRAWLWARHFGLHCVATYRFHRFAKELSGRRWLLGAPLLLLARLLNQVMRMLHHVELNADIGPGFYIGHATSIFIGRTRIGRNFSVTHNVTVGVGHQRGERGVPVLGDDVWVGTGSVLSGKIQIGDRVTITSGTMLSRDVPDGCLVGGNPGRVILKGYDNDVVQGRRQAGVDEPA